MPKFLSIVINSIFKLSSFYELEHLIGMEYMIKDTILDNEAG